ncbi:hypothetical protein AOQ84DRAFT_378689 [Glonium stellatum]|uniref:Rhodopsin domain-containing protein n=1 Tax=Glonium stellatum TaxID=574774 RepID=A0A8E2EXV3_9PEZI|nr:hypothetical protein AOQ84DRAFT_378689 [Glonium stellatum]
MASLRITPPLLWTAGTIWPPVCIVIVAARFATRKAQRARFGPDDWLTLPALALVLGMAATILAATAERGTGYPTPKPAPGTELTASSHPQTAFMAITLLQLSALAFIKLSCMLFYYRIFRKGTHRAFEIVIHVINALIVIWGFGFFFSFLFACKTHFDYFWTNLENQLKCPLDLSKIDLSLSISDVIMDVIILVFPIPLVLRLQMSTTNKVAVLAIFALGALAIAASATRLAIIVQELNVEFAAAADQDFVSTDALYFMYIEACFALCAVCLPSLSGALKLKGVQNLIDGFSAAFSNISRSSLRSRGSNNSAKKHERLNSAHSENPHSRSGSEHNSQFASRAETERDLEMYPLPKDKVITVTSRIEQNSSNE